MRREYPDAPIVGVGAVVIDGSMVLLVRRGQPPLKGEWSLPGGALELGETLRAGVVREVLEETGMVVVPGSIVEVLDRITYDEQRVRYHYVLIDFVCHVTGGSLMSGSDADDSCWVEHSELEKYNLAPITLQVIEKAFPAGREVNWKASASEAGVRILSVFRVYVRTRDQQVPPLRFAQVGMIISVRSGGFLNSNCCWKPDVLYPNGNCHPDRSEA